MRVTTMILAALALAVAAPAVSHAQAAPAAASVEHHPRAFRHRVRKVRRLRMYRRQWIRDRRFMRRHRNRFAI